MCKQMDGIDPTRSHSSAHGRIQDETRINYRHTGRCVIGCLNRLGPTLRSPDKRSGGSASSRSSPFGPPSGYRRSSRSVASRSVASRRVRPLGRTDHPQPILLSLTWSRRAPKHSILRRQPIWIRCSGVWRRCAKLRIAVRWNGCLHPSRFLPRVVIGISCSKFSAINMEPD